jgi:hypothetical protein
VNRLKSKLLAIPTFGSRHAAIGVFLVLFAVSPGSTASSGGQQEPAGEREAALKGFTERVNDYLEAQKELARGLPEPKPGDRATGKAEATQDTLAARIQVARKGSKPGDIFGDAAPYFKRIIAHDTQARGIRDAYAAMQEVPPKSPPAVNADYPEKAALATVPPLILVNLPRLPDGLEYRFMGRDLILRDREANLIVDFVPGAVPVLKQ